MPRKVSDRCRGCDTLSPAELSLLYQTSTELEVSTKILGTSVIKVFKVFQTNLFGVQSLTVAKFRYVDCDSSSLFLLFLRRKKIFKNCPNAQKY